MGWGNKAVVGFNAAGTYYANYNASGSSTVARIACLALPEEVNNVVYDLVPDPNNLQCTSSTPPPPISLGECHKLYVYIPVALVGTSAIQYKHIYSIPIVMLVALYLCFTFFFAMWHVN